MDIVLFVLLKVHTPFKNLFVVAFPTGNQRSEDVGTTEESAHDDGADSRAVHLCLSLPHTDLKEHKTHLGPSPRCRKSMF